MDLTLPDIHGEEATRRLKADPTTKGIPVIALTANAMVSDREKAIAAGCDDFDTKPVDMSRLLEKIEALNPHYPITLPPRNHRTCEPLRAGLELSRCKNWWHPARPSRSRSESSRCSRAISEAIMSKCILVVEDQEDNRQILRDLLGNAGYELTEAENGEEA